MERDRISQVVLILATLVGAWLGMQAAHELGHVLGTWATGARVLRVVLDPRIFSRTEVGGGSNALLAVWAGPVLGSLLPLAAWAAAARWRCRGAYLARFFAGFCLIANGVYLGVGSFGRVADAGDLLRLGAPAWALWLFGCAAAPAGLWLWHGEGRHFGLGAAKGAVSVRAALGVASAVTVWTILLAWWASR